MGSACVKEESKVIEADRLISKKEVLQSTDDDVLENGIEVDLKPKGNIDNFEMEIVYILNSRPRCGEHKIRLEWGE